MFKIHADTECFVKRNNSHEGEHTIKYQKHIPNSIGAKLACDDNRCSLPLIIVKGEKYINEFIKWMFRQKEWINRVIKEYLNEDLIKANEDE